ncbi:reverse transcriptase family protein [Paeniglutamicibacter sp. ABSL32-1]|nr:reverse transcriptase family protein [Paeniglutamicibacter quisquiliarum]
MKRRNATEALIRSVRRIENDCSRSGVLPIFTLVHLCVVSKTPYNTARDVIFDPRVHYSTRRMAKRSGSGFRSIHEPSPPLKALHRAILENCLPVSGVSDMAYAFHPGRDTLAAVRAHVGAQSMIRVDIKDFFGSIGTRRVAAIFMNLGYPELLALEMALLTTVGHEVILRGEHDSGPIYEIHKEGRLPQGASTSGLLANLICAPLDQLLSMVALQWDGVITRYADDICFSSHTPTSREKCQDILRDIICAIESQGFKLNSKKTRIHPKGKVFRILGLCVGESDVWLNRNYKRSLESHIHGVKKFGLINHSYSRGYGSDLEFIEFMWGHYAYSIHVDPTFGIYLKNQLQENNIVSI